MCYRIEEFSELGEVVPPASVDHLIHTANHMLLIDKPIRHSYGIRRSATQINECRAASLILLRIEFNIDSFLVRLPPQKRRAEGGDVELPSGSNVCRVDRVSSKSLYYCHWIRLSLTLSNIFTCGCVCVGFQVLFRLYQTAFLLSSERSEKKSYWND